MSPILLFDTLNLNNSIQARLQEKAQQVPLLLNELFGNETIQFTNDMFLPNPQGSEIETEDGRICANITTVIFKLSLDNNKPKVTAWIVTDTDSMVFLELKYLLYFNKQWLFEIIEQVNKLRLLNEEYQRILHNND